MKEIERDTKKRKEQVRNKHGVSERNTVIRVLNATVQKRQLEENQRAILELRKANKALRQESVNLRSGILSFRQENAKLVPEIASIHEGFNNLSKLRESEEEIYKKLNEGLPQYRQRVEELRTEGERRESMTRLENHVKDKYDKCTQTIFRMIQIRCDDNKMLEGIGSTSSRTCIVA